MQDMAVWARKRHPRWGPRKLRAWLVRLHPAREFPSASAMASILKRHDLTAVRRRRQRRRAPGSHGQRPMNCSANWRRRRTEGMPSAELKVRVSPNLMFSAAFQAT
jgi:hypothetical protein